MLENVDFPDIVFPSAENPGKVYFSVINGTEA